MESCDADCDGIVYDSGKAATDWRIAMKKTKKVPQTELRAFHAFVSEKLNNGSADLLPEEVLEAWRELHPEPFGDEDDVAAIQAALDEVDRGEAISFEEFDRELRKEFNLAPPPKKNESRRMASS